MLNNKTYYCFFFALLMMPYYLEAAPGCSTWIAKAESTQGKVDTQPSGSANWQSVRINDTFCPGDKVRTAKWSRSTLRLKNESVITIDQNSTLVFSEPAEAEGGWFLKLIDGSTFFRSRQPQRLNIQTPFINAIHEGTEFLVTVGNQQAVISVFDGQVTGENAAGRISIKKGFSGIAQNGAVPRLQALTVTPQDAVQWALYYPPVITYKPAKLSPVSPAIQSVLNAYRQGDHYQALSRLEALPSSEQNAQILALKASLLLSAGRVDEANATLQRILQSEPRNSDAFALQAIIAITKNQQQTALDFAGKAVALDPQSSAAQIALSYAHQSMLKIEPALTAAEAATRLSPDNALAWARLSELQLSTGDHDNALKSAQKAQTLQPDLSKSQTILGFVHLAELNVDNAKQAFAQAITLDSSDPLPRLGLGLAKIKQGDVDEGKQEMETAVNLDPNNSVIRSYLGKAYYELRNQDYAGTEYQLAKEMDPKDPTPWFYDAILKQTINRPVEALQDMQKAIELNDNRGVYRSRLLLDDDSAARSASQGRIYNDLGFQQRGLLEGWNSVNTDPSNYSAHRLLSDNYAALPRHEIARVSELLKAQLLQPINLTPVQPQSAESNILLLD
ncbi:MAG: tetratricopeptide repeat protein, partial [Methylococcaceae bacterium]